MSLLIKIVFVAVFEPAVSVIKLNSWIFLRKFIHHLIKTKARCGWNFSWLAYIVTLRYLMDSACIVWEPEMQHNVFLDKNKNWGSIWVMTIQFYARFYATLVPSKFMKRKFTLSVLHTVNITLET